MSEIALKAEDISKRFGGTLALNKAELEVKKGEVHALVGANGAGKSTLIKIITGAYSCDHGKLTLEGKVFKPKTTWEAKNAGISAVYQENSLINTISVAENIFMGQLLYKKIGPIKQVDWKKIHIESKKILTSLGVDIPTEKLVGTLSVAEKQMIEIAKALSQKLKVLILDEPTASLSEKEIEHLFQIVKDLKKRGISIIYVSHRLEELPIIADRISVYRDGKYIKTLQISDAPKNVIIENMVGHTLTITEHANVVKQEILLEAKNFSSGVLFQNINLTLYKGEILGIAGLAGAGRTEFVRALFGADKRDSGEVYIEGNKIHIRNCLDAKKAGIGFVTENRKEEGLIQSMDLHTNIGMTILQELKKKIGLDLSKEEEYAEQYIRSLSIKCRDCHQIVHDLSGGNQQKIVIAKWLATNPKILIMDEPTRGIDVGSKNQIYGLMNELAEKGIGIIMISSELPEVIQVSNRILVFAGGRKTAELRNENITQEQLLDYATKKQAVG